jgi:hypothetical protein
MNMNWLRALMSWPWPITAATILTALSATGLGLFWLAAFGSLNMPSFEAVGLPMQLAVIGMGIFLMVRFQMNRPESPIKSVPVPIRILVPAAVAVAALNLAVLMGSMLPSTTPAGNPVHAFNASVNSGVCVAVYNGSERKTEPLDYCAAYQSRVDRLFAASWLLFSALELWGAWAIYGAPPVQRVLPDSKRLQPIPPEPEAGAFTTQPGRAYLWLSVRAAIIAYWVVGGWQGFGQQPVPVPGATLVFATLFGAISTRYSVVQAYTSSKRTEPWLIPSWFLNPFQRSQPFQFFHLGGLSFLTFGLSHFARERLSGRPLGGCPPELFPAAFGLGILLGIYWAVHAYRSRFVRVAVV